MACFSSSFCPLFLDLRIGVQGSSGDFLVALLLEAVISVGVGLDLLAHLLEDLLDPGGFLQMLPVGALENLDVLQLVGPCGEHVGETVGIDDLVDILFFTFRSLEMFVSMLHLGVFRFFLVDSLGLACPLGFLLLE